MVAHADTVAQLPLAVLRWLLSPADRLSFITEGRMRLRERLRRPSEMRMSDEWLENFNKRAHTHE